MSVQTGDGCCTGHGAAQGRGRLQHVQHRYAACHWHSRAGGDAWWLRPAARPAVLLRGLPVSTAMDMGCTCPGFTASGGGSAHC
jgi:hypothetical protein